MPLKIDWVGHDAATWAVEHWHYSKTMPAGKLVKFGVWEDGRFVGVVLFGRGASPFLHERYSSMLGKEQVCELVRVALSNTHEQPVTKIVADCLRRLKDEFPRLRLVVSFADPAYGHHGGIYQAGNWIYTGQSSPTSCWVGPDGRIRHTRGAWQYVSDPKQRSKFREVRMPGKHRYLMPLDKAMRRAVESLRQPYPRPVGDEGGHDRHTSR